ncbi:MAG: GH92 family glycosyl hydrolase [bacterium]|nr:GH92 family glycosyl hydrolase [bacterium]
MRALGLLVAALAVPGVGAAGPSAQVSTFVGTAARTVDFGTGGGAGNTFPGASAPFGMLQWSPDTLPGLVNSPGGYTWDDRTIRGFSLTHLSGAGCSVFQDVPILPTSLPITRAPAVAGTWDIEPRYLAAFSHDDEAAEPGWYRVRLDPGTPRATLVELAARTRSGVGRFTFPATATASLLFNAGGSAMANGDVGLAIDPARREVSGHVAAGQFCYHRNRYVLHFVARFERAFAGFGTWGEQTLAPGSTAVARQVANPFHLRPQSGFPEFPHTSNGAQAGAWVTFDATADPVVRVRVAVSWVSVDGARRNLDAESPDFDVDAARAETRAAWDALLGRVAVAGGTPADTRTFYTMLYHALLAPNVFSDVDGAYAGMDGAVHRTGGWTKYANVSGWDVYRTQLPLLALLDPARTSHLVRSLLADAAESGWLPRWPVANGHTNVMVGDPASIMIASAHAFGARDFDTGAALAAMVKGATQTGRSPNADYVERGGLADYLRLGWVPHDGTETSTGSTTTIFGRPEAVWGSAATTLEWAAADFALARFAAATGDAQAARTMLRRSGAWRLLLDRTSGYLTPRYASGAFPAAFDPLAGEGFVEGNAAQYRWFVPFDPAGLVRALGGRPAAMRLLDAHLARLNEGPTSPYAFLGNEPSLGTPWLYPWIGRPWRTQELVRQALRELYDTTPAGLPGNDDLGTMSAWWVLGALGLYPAVPGDDVLVLGSPLFPHATVRLAGGDLVLDAPGAPELPYVHALRRDGREHPRAWLRFADVACGARLDYTLASGPDPRWGAKRRDAPPSYAARGTLRPPRGAACR